MEETLKTEAVPQSRECFLAKEAPSATGMPFRQWLLQVIRFTFALRVGAIKTESALKVAGSPGLDRHMNSLWESSSHTVPICLNIPNSGVRGGCC